MKMPSMPSSAAMPSISLSASRVSTWTRRQISSEARRASGKRRPRWADTLDSGNADD